MLDLVKSIIKRSSWSYYVLFFNLFTGLLHTGLLTRSLGLNDFGKYHTILAVSSIFMSLFAFTGSEAIIPYATKFKKNSDVSNLVRMLKSTISLLYFFSLLGFLIFVVFLLVRPSLAGIDYDEIYVGIIIGLTGIFGANIYSYINIMRVFDNYSFYFKQAVIFDSLRVAIVIALYFFDLSLSFYVTFLLIRQIAQMLVFDYFSRDIVSTFIGYRLKSFYTTKFKINSLEKNFFTFNFFTTKIRSLNLHLDKLLLSFFSGNPSVVGLFTASKKIMEVAELSFSNLITAIIPQIASDYFENRKKLLKNLLVQTSLVCLMGVPMICFFMFFIDKIIVLWMGEDFLPAASLTRIMLLAVLVKIIFFVISYFPISIGDAKSKFVATLTSFFATFGTIFLFYDSFSIYSFGYGILAGTISYSIIILMYSIKILVQKKEEY